MISVLPNGGKRGLTRAATKSVALDDISATEWRLHCPHTLSRQKPLHSMISVLPNGGSAVGRRRVMMLPLHSMISVLPNGGPPDYPVPPPCDTVSA